MFPSLISPKSGSVIDVQAGFWMEPGSGDLSNLSQGDDTGAVETGALTFVSGAATYSAGTVNAVAFPGSASRISYPNLTGHPFTTIAVDEDRGWWISGLYRLQEVASNEGMYGNGANSNSESGIRCLLTNNVPNIAICDGVNRPSVGPSGLGSAELNRWYHFLTQFKVDSAAGEITVRHIIDGWSRSAGGQAERVATGLDLSSAITPAHNWTVGDTRPSGTLPFKGDLVLSVGELPNNEFFDGDIVNAFSNYSRSRLYSDMSTQPIANALKYFIMGAPKQTSVPVTVRSDTDGTMTVNALNASTRTQEATANATVSNGLGKATLTGLTADTEYLLEFVSGGQIQRREGRVKTAPNSLDFNIAVCGCSKWTEFGTDIEVRQSPRQIAHVEKPLFAIWNGDMGYHDPTVNTLAHFLERMDTIIDHNNAKLFYDHVPIVYTADDHDSTGDDGDSSSPYITAARQYVRGINGLPDVDWPDANAWYHSIVIDDLRIIVLDTRSEKIDASQMISATQLTWVQDEIEAANTAGQVYIIVSPNIWRYDPSAPVPTQAWDHANFIAQRNTIFDKIHTEFGTVDHGLTLVGDVHMNGLDTGANQGDFDTGNLLTVPCMIASRMSHGAGATKGTWDTVSDAGTGAWGILRMTDNGTTVDVDMEVWKDLTQTLPTLPVTLTK